MHTIAEAARAIAHRSPLSVCLKDREGRYLYVNPAFERLHDVTDAAIAGRLPDEVHPPVQAAAVRERDLEVLGDGVAREVELMVSGARGPRTVLSVKFPVHDDAGALIGLGGIGTDVTERKKAELIRRSDERYRQLFEHAPISIWEEDWADAKLYVERLKRSGVTDLESHLLEHPDVLERLAWEVSVVDFNLATVETYRAPSKQAFWDRAIASFQTEGEWEAFRKSVVAFARGEVKVTTQAWEKTYDGRDLYVRDTVFIPQDHRDSWARVIRAVEDITEAHSLAMQLSYQASHDALTGLINRREFELRLERVLHTAGAESSEHALCYVDLDEFKVINDTCGHVAGDQLLRELGQLLRRKVRKRDSLARLGGDEFGLLMEHCDIEQAHRVAGVLRETIEQFRFKWDGKLFQIGASFGLVPITQEIRSVTDVLSAADAACYAAKERGTNRIQVYDRGDVAMARRHGEMQWVSRIGDALENDRFRLYFQPIESLAPGRRGGRRIELLLRLAEVGEPDIRPGIFLPAAERYGMKGKVDRWVIDHSIDWLRTHPGIVDSLELCCINISPQSLADDGFLRYVESQLNESPAIASVLCFEIAETMLISDLSFAERFVTTFRALGCRFALDDFGSGVSSFAHLKSLPVDYLKIDGSFVMHMLDNETDLAVVTTINDLAHLMGCETVAEFAESDAIVRKLATIGVDYAQGFALGAPSPLEELGRAAPIEFPRRGSIEG